MAPSAATLSPVEQESTRLEALDRFDVLDTPREEAFDRITRLARKLFGVPVAIVSFIDAHRQWYKSCVGMLRASIEAMVIDFGSKQIRVTASFGVASLDAATQDVETLLDHADQALYQAKRSGRNRCVAWRDPAMEISQPRRRVLKAGQILFNGNTSSIDCTVRSLSAEGAGIDVSSSLGIPKNFDLAIMSDGLEKPCRIVSAAERHIEVAFC